jgi:hypothetical protein
MEKKGVGGIWPFAAAKVILHACVSGVRGGTAWPVEEPGTYWFVETRKVGVWFYRLRKG